jgi:hypothetical protein
VVEWVCGVQEGALVKKGKREREVRRAAARFFLFVAQDWHGSLPPPSKHYKTKGRRYCYSRIQPEGRGGAGEGKVLVWLSFKINLKV